MARARGWAVVAAALVAPALAACPSSPSPPPDPDTLTVATYADFADQTRAALAGWIEGHPKVNVQLLALPPTDFAASLTPRLAAGVDAPDVLIVDAPLLARLGAAGALAELSRPPREVSLGDRAWPALAAEGRVGAAQLGVPADAAPAVLLYRTDLLARAGVTEADLTGSWEGFVAACGRVQAATGAYCLPGLRDLSEAVLRTGLRDGESPYFSEGLDPLPDAARAARAIRLAQTAQAAGIAANAAVGGGTWVEVARAGRFAVQLGGPTMIPRLARLDPGSSGKWRAAPLPGGAAVSAPSAFCTLAARGAHLELAWDLVRTACFSPAPALAAWRSAGAFPALVEAAGAPAVDEPVPFLGGQVVGPLFRAAAARLPVVHAHRLDPLASDAFALELDRAVQSGKDVQAAIADARAEIARRVKRLR